VFEVETLQVPPPQGHRTTGRSGTCTEGEEDDPGLKTSDFGGVLLGQSLDQWPSLLHTKHWSCSLGFLWGDGEAEGDACGGVEENGSLTWDSWLPHAITSTNSLVFFEEKRKRVFGGGETQGTEFASFILVHTGRLFIRLRLRFK
jgi:hypothetical protein